MVEKILQNRGIKAELVSKTSGINLESIEVKLSSPVRKLRYCLEDIAADLKVSHVTIDGPLHNKGTFLLQYPKTNRGKFSFNDGFRKGKFSGELPFLLGYSDSEGVITADLSTLPHLLVAGATGTGKSVFINSLITSLYKKSSKTHFVLIDPKQVELSHFASKLKLAFSMDKAVTDCDQAFNVLNHACNIMDATYKEMQKDKIRSIYERPKSSKYRPIVIIIDELADLIIKNKEVEEKIIRIAQLGRAAGIHLVVATQRPTAQVITGLIKSNIPARVAFSVSSKMDSRIVLDESGAESLLGKGDLIFKDGKGKKMRLQGALI